jgi:hypothetical protein
MKILFHRVIILALFATVSPHGVADEETIQWIKKFHALGELIDRSSVSRQVLSSNNEASLQQYKLAQSLREQAVTAYREGKYDESNMFIEKSKKALFEAAKLSGSGESRKDKEKKSYESMKRSMYALLEAMERIGTEKGHKKQVEQIAEKTRNLIKQADQFVSSGKHKEGVAVLGKAVYEIDNKINEMRSGDTLTRTLSFASPKEEYQYERERNDTHLMLVNVYLAENPAEGEARSKIYQYLDGARAFRSKAEDMASTGKYQDAVREMESSTVNIIRAIRAMGVYIPG